LIRERIAAEIVRECDSRLTQFVQLGTPFGDQLVFILRSLRWVGHRFASDQNNEATKKHIKRKNG
jgi:hypothetical protein